MVIGTPALGVAILGPIDSSNTFGQSHRQLRGMRALPVMGVPRQLGTVLTLTLMLMDIVMHKIIVH
jgi:hypothetical protein